MFNFRKRKTRCKKRLRKASKIMKNKCCNIPRNEISDSCVTESCVPTWDVNRDSTDVVSLRMDNTEECFCQDVVCISKEELYVIIICIIRSVTGDPRGNCLKCAGSLKDAIYNKSYKWALETMSYVSILNMENSAKTVGLEKLLKNLCAYMAQHPDKAEQIFAAVMNAAGVLRYQKFLEQCRLAKTGSMVRQSILQDDPNQAEIQRTTKRDGSKPNSNLMLRASHSLDRPIDDIFRNARSDRTFIVHLTEDSSSQTLNEAPAASVHEGLSAVRGEYNCGLDQSCFWEPRVCGTGADSDQESPFDPVAGTDKALGMGSGSCPSCPLYVTSSSVSASPLIRLPVEQIFLHGSTFLIANSPKIPQLLSSSSSPSCSTQCVQTSLSSSRLPDSPLKVRRSSAKKIFAGTSVRGSDRVHLERPLSRPRQHGGRNNLGNVTPGTRQPRKTTKTSRVAPESTEISSEQKKGSGFICGFSGAPEHPSYTEDNEINKERTLSPISLITAASQHLPSMPEEEMERGKVGTDPECADQDQRANTFSARDCTPVPVNSHLHGSAWTLPAGPATTDASFSEAEVKNGRRACLVMAEMIQTERDYVRALQFVIDNYVPELQREDVPQMLHGKRAVIFGNLEKIHQFHSQWFLKHLEKCQKQPFSVGQYFLQYETMFYLYALYNKNKPKSDSLMMEYGKDYFRQKQLELGDKMDLSSYLLKPVQRMGKYALLLKQLLKECPETELEYPELKAAEKMVKFQLRHGNDLLALDSLRDCDVNIQEQGRLLRQEEFLVFQGRKKCMRQVFLFEDLILFSKTKRSRRGQHGIYIYKTSFKTADIGLTENYGDGGYRFEIWFRRRSVGENYVLQASSSEVKNAWVTDISRLLWRQAIHNKESYINELATMGIGLKPCHDIKPSTDNIQDRSINTSLIRGAQSRKTIAVSSLDYMRNGNKRPHSIISVSSTSSSGSSQSSVGLVGSLNLAFDPLDSPHMNQRSCSMKESTTVSESDTSRGDRSSERKDSSFHHPAQANVSSLWSYLDLMKSRVLKQKHSNQMFTDV